MTTILADRIRGGPSGAILSLNQAEQQASYCELLNRWNRTVNLTALQLDGFPESSLGILIHEPVAAVTLVPETSMRWLDLGSGSGSPAIPMKIACPRLKLTMVESRSRKGAFLQEAIRALNLKAASVLVARIEQLASSGPADLVTVRAVRIDEPLVQVVASVLGPGGRLIVFAGQPPSLVEDRRFTTGPVATSPVGGRLICSFDRVV